MTPIGAYLCIAIFWLINGIINIPDSFGIDSTSDLSNRITLVYNLIETPLALCIFYFASTGWKKRTALYLIPLFILFEWIVLIRKGHNFESSTIIIGVGSFIAMIYCLMGIGQYFSKVQHNYFESTLGFVYAGFIFYYGLGLVVYYFSYLNFQKSTVPYTLFVYNLSLICATGLISYGFWIERRRHHSSSSS